MMPTFSIFLMTQFLVNIELTKKNQMHYYSKPNTACSSRDDEKLSKQITVLMTDERGKTLNLFLLGNRFIFYFGFYQHFYIRVQT